MKNCQEIEIEIEEVRKLLKSKRLTKTKIELAEQQKKCSSNNALVRCDKCDCWKLTKEYYS